MGSGRRPAGGGQSWCRPPFAIVLRMWRRRAAGQEPLCGILGDNMKRLSILGSTGSIGRQTLEVCDLFPADFTVVALTAQQNVELLAAQAKQYRPSMVAIGDPDCYNILKEALSGLDCAVLAGAEGVAACAACDTADLVVGAISGIAGLTPVLAAIEQGKDVALANKEVLVAAGSVVMERVAQKGVTLLPVDSEHSAIFQCLTAAAGGAASLLLTASGGPFRDASLAELAQVTPADALRHPTWNMGRKITIDSATMMNKGLEIIEARWLFNVDYDHIQVVIQPQSMVHSMVQMVDGAVIAHLGYPDMRTAIQFALTYPQRRPNPAKPVDFAALQQIVFQAPDEGRFPCLALARAAGRAGGTAPAVLNGANEYLVWQFLAGKIGFLDIPRMIEQVLAQHNIISQPTLQEILAADEEGRRLAARLAGA